MTLSSRNRYFFIFGITSTFCICALSFFAVQSFINQNAIGIITNNARVFEFLQKLPQDSILLQTNFFAMLASASILTIYVPLCLALILHYFGRTHVTEIFYFSFLLLSCFTEAIRIVIPVFFIFEQESVLYTALNRILLFMRLFGGANMLIATFFAQEKFIIDSAKIEFLLAGFCAIVALAIPINNIKYLASGFAPYAFLIPLFNVQILMYIFTIIGFYQISVQTESLLYKKVALSFAHLALGLLFLQYADCILSFAIGFMALIIGTVCFFRHIHQIYLYR